MMPDAPIWTPSEERVRNARLTEFLRFVGERFGCEATDYASLWQWSIDYRVRFWEAMWEYAGVIASRPWDAVLTDGDRMPGATWFRGARLNYAENLLRYRDDRPAIVSWNEAGRQQVLTYAELHGEVARIGGWLRREGIGPGDRVAAYLPNCPETIIAMLAAASVGATFSSCSPDFGVEGVVDRFGQIEPAVLFTVDACTYAGKTHDCLSRVEQILERIPSIRRTVVLPVGQAFQPDRVGQMASAAQSAPGQAGKPDLRWHDIPPADSPLVFEQLPFDHPLYVLFSSGTTGVPKCIVHGAGGTLLQHLKEHQLHTDVRRDDRLFYFTTCGWMMWNWLVSGLASGCTLVLFDGSPFHPNPGRLWDMAEAEGITVFGTSAKYLSALEKTHVVPRESRDLSSLRTILSTGSPLAPESFDFVYSRIKRDVCLSSISGGTDIVSCFVLGNPIGPVWRGEIQCAGLGLAVDVFDEDGNSLPPVGQAFQPDRVGQVASGTQSAPGQAGKPDLRGELVCTKAFPSMPVSFWNDPDGAGWIGNPSYGNKYRAAYFERFPGVWHHGDYAEKTPHGGYIISGRSDAVLNPGGVRIGTAEIYRQVEQLPEVVEAIAVGQQWRGDERIVLFVRLRDGVELDETLRDAIREKIRGGATPRHVPARIVSVPDIPRTKSGKIVEIAVRDVVQGRDVKNLHALANPESLQHFANRPELAR
jgi:acetoacetyl-CoA synthetase